MLNSVIAVAVMFGILLAVLAALRRIDRIETERERRANEAQLAADAARLAAEKAKHIAEREAAERARLAQQESYLSELNSHVRSADALLLGLVRRATEADLELDAAERDFVDRVFAPFWNHIEAAVQALAQINRDVGSVEKLTSEFVKTVPLYEGAAPVFPIARDALKHAGYGKNAARRMQQIVRTAQADFQFATIFEQRRTNQILDSGFANLGQAIDSMAARLDSSIDRLGSSIDSMALDLESQLEGVNSQLDSAAIQSDEQHRAYKRIEEGRAMREDKALDMLDNIQRGKKPI